MQIVVQSYPYQAQTFAIAAEHAVPADRFARKIVAFLKTSRGALAAAERQSVGPPPLISVLANYV